MTVAFRSWMNAIIMLQSINRLTSDSLHSQALQLLREKKQSEGDSCVKGVQKWKA